MFCLLYIVKSVTIDFYTVKIISQFRGVIKSFDQSGDRVSKNDKRYHIFSVKLMKTVLGLKFEKYGTLSIFYCVFLQLNSSKFTAQVDSVLQWAL